MLEGSIIVEHVSVRIRSPFFTLSEDLIVSRFFRLTKTLVQFSICICLALHTKRSRTARASSSTKASRVRQKVDRRAFALPSSRAKKKKEKNSVSFTKKRRNIGNINKTPSPAVAGEITTIFHLLRSRSTRQIVVNLSRNHRRDQATDNFLRLSVLIPFVN